MLGYVSYVYFIIMIIIIIWPANSAVIGSVKQWESHGKHGQPNHATGSNSRLVKQECVNIKWQIKLTPYFRCPCRQSCQIC